MGRKNRRKRATPPPPQGAPGIVRLLKAGERFLQPDIWVVDQAGTPRVWKTWARRPGHERLVLCRWLAKREAAIIRRLQHLEGFPAFISMPNAFTVEMSLLDAEPVPEQKGRESLDEEYFRRLEQLLAQMHDLGVNHGDLRRKNLLRQPGNPSLPRMVDFTQCLSFRPPVTGLRRIVFREAIAIDRVTFLKLKRWYLGDEALSPEEMRELERQPWHLLLGRFIRKKLYRPYKHLREGRQRRVGKHT